MSDLSVLLFSFWQAEIFLLIGLGVLSLNHPSTKQFDFLLLSLISLASLFGIQFLIYLDLADDPLNFFTVFLLGFMPIHLILHPRVDRTNFFLDRSTEIAMANFILILTLIANDILFVIFAVWGLILIRKELKPFLAKRPFSFTNLKMSSWVVVYLIALEIPLYYQAIDLNILFSLFVGFNALFLLGIFSTYQHRKAHPVSITEKVELRDLEQVVKDEATKSVESRLVGLFDKSKDKSEE